MLQQGYLQLQISPYLLVVVAGPTASGKSALALRLAEELGGEIVNFDSVQVYRGLDIGSAKTTVSERRSIPHHLLDILSVEEELSAGEYARRAEPILREIETRGRIPILAGGSGFYLRALLDGLSPAPVRDPALRKRLAELGCRRPLALHRFLRLRDPERARAIHPNDLQKLIRAIELAGFQAAPRRPLSGFRIIKIGLAPDRTDLYQRINKRVISMFDSGLLEETATMLARGAFYETKSLQTLGYKQAIQVLTGSLTREAAIAECQTQTRQYAKRQLTWFRSDSDIHWLTGFGDDQVIQTQALLEISLRNKD